MDNRISYLNKCIRAIVKVGPIEAGELVYCFLETDSHFYVNVMTPKYGVITEIKVANYLKDHFVIKGYEN